MPNFVKTPRDEARWKKAKEAAGKETEVGSESYYKLSNYIYHKMGKTEEDQKMAELYKSEIANTFISGKELNIENLRHFLMNDISISTPTSQSSQSNEVRQMSEEKKYSAKDAAIAVLKKAEEMLKKSKMLKDEQPVGEIHPKEHVEGEAVNPGQRIKEQIAPDMNPKEQKEGNNKEWGTAPETYGTLKLAKFIGHMHAKRKMKKSPGAM